MGKKPDPLLIRAAKAFFEEVKRRKPSYRINDLVVKFHRVKSVELPLPNFFALEQIDSILGDIESINITDPRQLSTLVWILTNQSDSRIAELTALERRREIDTQMRELPAHQFEEYVACVFEIFTAIKKKRYQKRIQYLEETRANLDGSEPSSPLRKQPEGPSTTSSSN